MAQVRKKLPCRKSPPRAMSLPLKLARAGCISGSIMTFGDVAVQMLIENKCFRLDGHADSWDTTRTVRWSIAGLTLHGPYFFATFGMVDKYFGNVTSLWNVLRKTAFVQVTVFPGYLTMLFAYLGIMEGIRQQDALLEKVKLRVPEAFAGGCVFWPLVNTVNFSLVPPTMRVPYLASAGTLWNTFLSYINAHDEWKYYFSGPDSSLLAEIEVLKHERLLQDEELSRLRERIVELEATLRSQTQSCKIE